MIHRNLPYLNQSELLAAIHISPGRSEFEKAVACKVDMAYAISFAYGHAGAIASFKALGLRDSDIILPAYTCSLMADAVVASGNRPIFVDIDLTDYNMSLDAMKAALTPNTRAVITTHMYGYPTAVDTIREIIGDERVIIMEDRAMLGPLAEVPNAKVAGDICLFSFGPSKHLFSVQGGIITTNSFELYEKIKTFRDKEMNQLPRMLWGKRWSRFLLSYFPNGTNVSWNVLKRPSSEITGIDMPSEIDSPLIAGDYATALSDFQARIGLIQLRKFDAIIEKRRKIADWYLSELSKTLGLTLAPTIPEATYSYYSIRLEQRDSLNFRQRMLAQGIEVGQVYDHVLPFRKRFRHYANNAYPNSEILTREVINLPIHPRLGLQEVTYIAEHTRNILQTVQ